MPLTDNYLSCLCSLAIEAIPTGPEREHNGTEKGVIELLTSKPEQKCYSSNWSFGEQELKSRMPVTLLSVPAVWWKVCPPLPLALWEEEAFPWFLSRGSEGRPRSKARPSRVKLGLAGQRFSS